jgi:hypothetical protein
MRPAAGWPERQRGARPPRPPRLHFGEDPSHFAYFLSPPHFLSRFRVHKTLSCHPIWNLTILFNRLLVLPLSHARVKIQTTINHYYLVASHPSLMFARIPTYHHLILMTAVTKHQKLVASNYRTVLQLLVLEILSKYIGTIMNTRGDIEVLSIVDQMDPIDLILGKCPEGMLWSTMEQGVLAENVFTCSTLQRTPHAQVKEKETC